MIPYTLIVTSASRPHLLKPTLESLLRQIDQPPMRIVLHDDAAFPGKWEEVKLVIQETCAEHSWSVLLTHADPPRRLGLAINWLLANVETEYVLYSQDDFVTVRPVPLARALQVMQDHQLHHIRFNKRATLAFKETWAGTWQKEERVFQMRAEHSEACDFINQVQKECICGLDKDRWTETLTISDHWYFQLGLWRVSEMRKALAFWQATPERQRRLAVDEVENMINHYFDHVAYGGDSTSPPVRATNQKTFIWGPVGEDRYIRHIGGDKEDWAGGHERRGAVDEAAKAWREINSYPHP